MISRRQFFSSLAATPIAFVSQKRRIPLPISVDLSMTGLQHALLLGDENNFGKALRLVIGPENRFIARELLWSEKKPYQPEGPTTTANPLYGTMGYVETREFPMWYWHVEFERGVVLACRI